jgi:CubicO group peptidase (beta-lactamase class C family)
MGLLLRRWGIVHVPFAQEAQMRTITAMIMLLFGFSATGLSAEETLGSGFFDPIELQGFVDGVMEAQQKVHHFAGAVVVVVREGQVVFQKGYGYADFVERKAVDPEQTLFRIASNSKMFVLTAVMQLVEKGTLDLHTDINRYLEENILNPLGMAHATLAQPLPKELAGHMSKRDQ